MNKVRRFSFYIAAISLMLLSIGCSGMLDIPEPNVSVTSRTGGYSVSEKDGELEIDIAIGREPTGDVTIPFSVNDGTEATLVVSSVTISKKNWYEAQTIVVYGVDEFIKDGNQDILLEFGEITSTDKSYDGYTEPSVEITVIDNETDSIVASPKKGLSTTESGVGTGACTGANNTATFTVVLGSQPVPTFTVTVPVASNDTSEGKVTTPIGGVLTFTDADYNIPQTVIVTCEDDNVLDGSVPYGITVGPATSDEIVYQGMSGNTVPITNNDDEVASIVVTPTILNLTEGGVVGTFTVTLNNAPTGTANFAVTSADPTRATVGTPIPGGVLTFEPENPGIIDYPFEQTVTVTPIDYDNIDDPAVHQVMVVIGPADANYQNENPPDVTVNITDDDAAGIKVSNLSWPTNDHGLAATFTVELESDPTDDVTIELNEKYNVAKNGNNELGTIDKTSLTFKPSATCTPTIDCYNDKQTVTVTGVVNYIDHDNTFYYIELKNAVSAGSDYNGKAAGLVTVNHEDSDTAGFTLTGSSLVTDKMGNLAKADYSTFTLKLNSEPTGTVTLNLVSSSPDDGTTDKSTLTFNTTRDGFESWNVPQTVTVHVSNVGGTQNGNNPGDHTYSITWTNTTAGGVDYNGLAVPGVSIHSCDNFNNEVVGCWQGGTPSTSENGGTATLYFITKGDPGQDVNISGVTSSNTGEGTVQTSATITTSNWNTMTGANKIVVTGVDELDVPTAPVFDGNTLYNIVFGTPTASGNATYSGITIPTITLRNYDNEQALKYNIPGGTTTTELGGSTTFNIQLGMAPTADVTFTLACKSGSTECASVNPTSITFTSGNWNVDKTVTITGKNDFAADGNAANCVSFGELTTTDLNFLDADFLPIIPPDYCGITNLDDDKKIFVTATIWPGNMNATDASGGTAAVDLKCDSDANNPGGGTYKALVAREGGASGDRIATTDGSTSAGQTNWVLQADTEYYKKSGGSFNSKVFKTNAFALVGFPFDSPISTANEYWTGFNTNWTTNTTENCGNWWVSNVPGGLAQIGMPNVVDNTAISGNTASCYFGTPAEKSIICVQQ